MTTQAYTKLDEDSLKAVAINKEAENPNFIHAYLLISTAGNTVHTAFGHAAIRMVCESKKLDYCFSFDNDRDNSSLITQFNRKSKAGFNIIPTGIYIKDYQQEGRGISSYDINLTPKEKQNLWKFLDEQNKEGLVWTFDYTSINCLSMALFAINKAIEPNQIHFKKMPAVVYQDLDTWMDYITEDSPWIRIVVHAGLRNVDDTSTNPEDLLIPTMMNDILPYAIIKDADGTSRPLTKYSPKVILKATCKVHACWFTPNMAVILLVFVIGIVTFLFYKKQTNKH